MFKIAHLSLECKALEGEKEEVLRSFVQCQRNGWRGIFGNENPCGVCVRRGTNDPIIKDNPWPLWSSDRFISTAGCVVFECIASENRKKPRQILPRSFDDYKSSFKSFSLIQPHFLSTSQNSQLRMAGRIKLIRIRANQSIPVTAAFAPEATSLIQPV